MSDPTDPGEPLLSARVALEMREALTLSGYGKVAFADAPDMMASVLAGAVSDATTQVLLSLVNEWGGDILLASTPEHASQLNVLALELARIAGRRQLVGRQKGSFDALIITRPDESFATLIELARKPGSGQ